MEFHAADTWAYEILQLSGRVTWNEPVTAAPFQPAGEGTGNEQGSQQVDFGGIQAIAVSPDRKWPVAGDLHKASNPVGVVHEPLVLLFDLATQKLEKQLIAEGITQGVIWRLKWLSDGSIIGLSGGGSSGFCCSGNRMLKKFTTVSSFRALPWMRTSIRTACRLPLLILFTICEFHDYPRRRRETNSAPLHIGIASSKEAWQQQDDAVFQNQCNGAVNKQIRDD